MSNSSFQVGDIVQLKSGGPDMTVESLFNDPTGKPFVYCQWFDRDQKVETAKFPPAMLEKIYA